MADEKDIFEEIAKTRMASKKELKNLDIAKKRPLAAHLNERMGLVERKNGSLIPEKQLSSNMKEATSLDDLIKKGSSKVGMKGLGKVAAGVAGLPLLLASEAADAAEAGNPLDDDMAIAEAEAMDNYESSQAAYDAGRGREPRGDKYFQKLRDIKDKRRDNILEGLEEGFLDSLEEQEKAKDTVEQGMSKEDKELRAAEHKAKKMREFGID